MIRSIRHKGLRRLYEQDDDSAIGANMWNRIREILSILDAASSPEDANIPGYRLHPLHGDRKGFWRVKVTGNWRIVFRFEDGNAEDLDLLDYH